MIKLNKPFLARWVFTIANSALLGGVLALGGLTAMFKVAPTDFNFLSTYNWGIVLQAGAYLFFFGFLGALCASLLRSPLHFEDVFITEPDTKVVTSGEVKQAPVSLPEVPKKNPTETKTNEKPT